jgi:hypothetical protein
MALPYTDHVSYGALIDFDVTNLHSLADTNIWGAEAVVGQKDSANGVKQAVEIFYSIELAGNFAAADSLDFGVLRGDGGSPEIWEGLVAEAQGQVTDAGEKATILSALQAFETHQGATGHLTTVNGRRVFSNPGPDWKLIMRVNSNAVAASGSIVRWRYISDMTED